MKINKLILLILLAICITGLTYSLLLIERKEASMEFLRDKELILKKRIKDLAIQRNDTIDLSNIYGLNDSLYCCLSSRIQKSGILVLLIHEKQCQDCVIKQVNRLKQLPQELQNNIILLTNFKEKRDVNIFVSINKIGYPVYNSKLPILNELENSAEPTFFILDSSNVPQHIFTPISIIPELSDEYLKFVVTDFFKVKKYTSGKLIEINIARNEYNLGKLKLNERIETKIEIQNISDVPLIISEAKSDCGCTVVDWEKNPILHNKKTLIKVLFNAEKLGVFVKKVYVFSNASNSPHVFLFKGEVK